MKHDDGVTSAQFSADGQRVLTASAERHSEPESAGQAVPATFSIAVQSWALKRLVASLNVRVSFRCDAFAQIELERRRTGNSSFAANHHRVCILAEKMC